MLAINFKAFPLSMSRKGAQKVIRQFVSDAKLPADGHKLLIGVPMSGTVIVTKHGEYFKIEAEPMVFQA